MFNHSDPTMWGLCLRAATGKKQNPAKLIACLWQGFHRHWIKGPADFFQKAVGHKNGAVKSHSRIKAHRCAALDRVNFELLGVYAATDQANSSSAKTKAAYPGWRRRRYPLGLAHEAVEQMILPLAVVPGKKSAAALFEAELRLRTSMHTLTAEPAGWSQVRR